MTDTTTEEAIADWMSGLRNGGISSSQRAEQAEAALAAMREAQQATMTGFELKRAPRPALFLERLAVSRGAPEIAAQHIVASVLEDHKHLPDTSESWETIFKAVIASANRYQFPAKG